jgi:hypothetical protein
VKMYGLFRADGELVTAIGAFTAQQARELLIRGGWLRLAQPGDRIRRLR